MTMTLADMATPTASTTETVRVSPRAGRPVRRTFPSEYKDAIVAEYDAAEHGERGAILRREGLYSSHIIDWRKRANGPGTTPRLDRRDREIEALRARAEKAEAELARVKAALDLVGKAHALLETLSESTGLGRRSSR